MANEQNLRPGEYKLSQEEAKRGGIKSGEVRRRKRNTKQILEMLAAMPFKLKDEKGKDLNWKQELIDLGIPEEEITFELVMNYTQFLTAMSGKYNSVNAATYIRDTLGDKPVDSMNVDIGDSKKLKDVFSQIGGEGLSE